MKALPSLILLIVIFASACTVVGTETPIASLESGQTTLPLTETIAPTATPTLRPRPKPGDDLGFIKGMSYASWSEDVYAHPLADHALEELEKTGTNWVAVIANTQQDDAAATEIDIFRNTDESIIHAIETAHRLNLNVMLKPHVDFTADSEHWRGQIGQGFDATKWDQWFDSYSKMILHYARLAEENGVDMFCIGTELNVPQQQTAHFQKLAADVRLVFHGPLTYASNWDAYQHDWWDSVDYIGVDAYFPLTEMRGPSIEQAVAGWSPISPRLEALSKKWDRPLIFTEIGYSTQEYAARNPASEENGALNPQTQANLYQATFDVFRDKAWFHGMFWWMWEDTVYAGGMCDYHHTPKDKLAENVLRVEYGVGQATLPAPARLPVFDEANLNTYPIFTDSYGQNIEFGWSWGMTEKIVEEPVFLGQHSLELNYEGWAGFSPHLQNIDTTPYQWLEFYIYTAADVTPSLMIRVADAGDQSDYIQSLTRCNYFDNMTGIKIGQWNRVLIPLEQINADQRTITRIVLEHWSSDLATIWVDEMRLVGLK